MDLARIKNTCLAVLFAHTLGCAAEGEIDEGETVEVEGQSQALTVADWGYSSLPRGWYHANTDGRQDYCRFVGNRPHIFISCKLEGNSNEYAHNSLTGIDVGYSNRPRGFRDFDGDGRVDYCRFVGNSPNIVERCVKGRSGGFEMDQYWSPVTMQPPPPPQQSPYRWIDISCQCTNTLTILPSPKSICTDPGNGGDWAARGICQLGCMSRGWGTELIYTYSAFGGPCNQDGVTAFL